MRRSGSRKTISTTGSAAHSSSVLSMVINLTTLALAAGAAKEIGAADLPLGLALLVAAVLIVLIGIPAWTPPVLALVDPDVTRRVLGGLEALVRRHKRAILVTLMAGAGLLLILRGVVRLP